MRCAELIFSISMKELKKSKIMRMRIAIAMRIFNEGGKGQANRAV